MSSPKRLYRNSSSGRIAGVCAGIAEYLDADVTLVRLAWVVLSIVPGGLVGGLIAYIAAWAIMPDSSIPASAEAGDPPPDALDHRSQDRRGVRRPRGYLSVDSTAGPRGLGDSDDHPGRHRAWSRRVPRGLVHHARLAAATQAVATPSVA